MKKIKNYAIILVIVVLFVAIFAKSNVKNAEAVIAKDYSTITYEGEVYVPVQRDFLPEQLKFSDNNDWIEATVEGQNYFLDKYFFTDYICVVEYDGEKFIYLSTDYDKNESNYYCLPSYKEAVICDGDGLSRL